MGIHFKVILLLICSQIFLFLLHIAVLRILIKKKASFSPLSVVVKCALFGNIPLLLIAWFLLAKGKIDAYGIINGIIYVLITYNILAYSYSHIFNMSETARRIRILYELGIGGSFRYNELIDKYGAKDMFDVRLERLKGMNQIAEHNGHFVLDSLWLYRIGMVVLKWGFFLKYNIGLRKKLKDLI